jgi:hypothetical protein
MLRGHVALLKAYILNGKECLSRMEHLTVLRATSPLKISTVVHVDIGGAVGFDRRILKETLLWMRRQLDPCVPVFAFFSIKDPLCAFAITICAIAIDTVADFRIASIIIAIGFNAFAGVLHPTDLRWTFTAVAAVAVAVPITAVAT